jgi:hypothetical protein
MDRDILFSFLSVTAWWRRWMVCLRDILQKFVGIIEPRKVTP